MGHIRTLLLAGAALVALAPVAIAAPSDWNIDPYTVELSDLNLTVGGEVYGTAFSANQPSAPGIQTTNVTGAATLTASVQRDYDSGLSLGVKSAFEIYHDKLSGDNYGSDLVQKVYGVAQTGLGRVELGMTDGAAYALSVTGPVVDGEMTLDNSNASLFTDPSTGRDFTNLFALNSAVESSLNYSKISYYTPRLLGIEIGASFTPSQGKDVIPFLSNGPHVANREKSIWETAVSYSDSFGPYSLGFYGGLSVGRNDTKTAGHASLTDWGVGSQIDYDLNDDVKLSLGGAYRHANTYGFDIGEALLHSQTNSAHLSAMASFGPWLIGGEIGDGTAEGTPKLGVRGYEASVGYVINANFQVTAGWQELRYSRDAGIFYNGASRIRMDGAYLHLKLHV